jgi:ribosomal protein L12E/L44/L45/RPP1/RPP2
MMNRWGDPRVAISFALIAIFAVAVFDPPDDEQMKAAAINLVIMAIGYWMGAAKSNEQATENTGKAFDAIAAAANSVPLAASEAGAAKAADRVADAAVTKAAEIKGEVDDDDDDPLLPPWKEEDDR